MNAPSTEEMKFQFATRESSIAPEFDKPLFIVAYWPHGQWWKIHKDLFGANDVVSMNLVIETLKMNGWAHIQIMRLPDQSPV